MKYSILNELPHCDTVRFFQKASLSQNVHRHTNLLLNTAKNTANVKLMSILQWNHGIKDTVRAETLCFVNRLSPSQRLTSKLHSSIPKLNLFRDVVFKMLNQRFYTTRSELTQDGANRLVAIR